MEIKRFLFKDCHFLFVLLVLLVVGCFFLSCTKSNQWTEAQFNEALQNCVINIPSHISQEFARIYCNCTLSAASIRYTFNDFAANEEEYINDFVVDGIVDQCNELARQMTN